MEPKKLFIVVNVDWAFLSHRLPIAIEAKNRGFHVTIVTSDSGRKSEIELYGLNVINVNFDRSGKNPIFEFKTLYSLWKVFKKNKPDIIHLVAIKPCIYGSIAAKLTGIKKIVIAVIGLGYNFTERNHSFFSKTLLSLFKHSTKGNKAHFIFQNLDDAKFIINLNKLNEDQYTIIKGCGVDLNEFAHQEEPSVNKIRFVLPARLLYDKGIVEFIQAANKIRDFAYGKAEFFLVGRLDPNNLSGIVEDDLNKYLVDGYITWTGFSSDINSVLRNCHVVVLPSYREGLPKSLIEASAIGRPIITTDAPGCRDCVQDGVNGFLVPIKDSEILADKMKILIENKELRYEMGKQSRIIAEKEYAIHISINATFKIYTKILDYPSE